MIYYEFCSCKENYIGESKCNVATWFGELNNLIYDSDPVKNLNKNIQHSCNLTILANASMHIRSRNSSEATYITFLRPHLNDQLKFSKLLLFRDGIM